ncbi:hypothetical protein J5069_08615 [Candidatus Symbiopectobacterium sp. NZEC127]|nr:hypothetical protein [Candidatus Symbiopectobacterium sp. NZEC127]
MKVDVNDAQVITAYIRASGYNGPVFIDLARLKEIHMPTCEVVAHMSVVKAQVAARRKAV